MRNAPGRMRAMTCPRPADPRRDAHVLSVRVFYPWHPCHGQVLAVTGSHCVAGERSYVVTLADGTKTHLPIWMTESAATCDVTLVALPRVSVAALEQVRSLLDHARLGGEG